jgi:hypothetical protein
MSSLTWRQSSNKSLKEVVFILLLCEDSQNSRQSLSSTVCVEWKCRVEIRKFECAIPTSLHWTLEFNWMLGNSCKRSRVLLQNRRISWIEVWLNKKVKGFTHVLVRVGSCWFVLVCVGLCWFVLVCVGLCWFVLVRVGSCCMWSTNIFENIFENRPAMSRGVIHDYPARIWDHLVQTICSRWVFAHLRWFMAASCVKCACERRPL